MLLVKLRGGHSEKERAVGGGYRKKGLFLLPPKIPFRKKSERKKAAFAENLRAGIHRKKKKNLGVLLSVAWPLFLGGNRTNECDDQPPWSKVPLIWGGGSVYHGDMRKDRDPKRDPGASSKIISPGEVGKILNKKIPLSSFVIGSMRLSFRETEYRTKEDLEGMSSILWRSGRRPFRGQTNVGGGNPPLNLALTLFEQAWGGGDEEEQQLCGVKRTQCMETHTR